LYAVGGRERERAGAENFENALGSDGEAFAVAQ